MVRGKCGVKRMQGASNDRTPRCDEERRKTSCCDGTGCQPRCHQQTVRGTMTCPLGRYSCTSCVTQGRTAFAGKRRDGRYTRSRVPRRLCADRSIATALARATEDALSAAGAESATPDTATNIVAAAKIQDAAPRMLPDLRELRTRINVAQGGRSGRLRQCRGEPRHGLDFAGAAPAPPISASRRPGLRGPGLSRPRHFR